MANNYLKVYVRAQSGRDRFGHSLVGSMVVHEVFPIDVSEPTWERSASVVAALELAKNWREAGENVCVSAHDPRPFQCLDFQEPIHKIGKLLRA